MALNSWSYTLLYLFYYWCRIFLSSKFLLFYNVQTNTLTCVAENLKDAVNDIALCSFNYTKIYV